jgi:hypothetical protein
MSKLETNTIDTVSGTTNLTIGSTNTSTITMPNGALSGQNYPAFEASISANQSIAENTFVKAELDTEHFDTDSCYDNSTNYRFTPTVAGKYLVYGTLHIDTTSNNLIECRTAIYKNGSIYKDAARIVYGSSGYGNELSFGISYVIDFNGSSDYVELYGYLNANGNATRRFLYNFYNVFGAYRIGA